MMTRPDITSLLAGGQRLLMDGGTGSELHRRGINVNKGTPGDRSAHGAWSATANLDEPDAVRTIHEDYLSAGADAVTSNSFWTDRIQLSRADRGEIWEKHCRASGQLAIEARDAVRPEAYVLGGIAPPEDADPYETYDVLYEKAMVLAEVGVDVILPEYLRSVDDCVQAAEACSKTGRPVWLGVTHPREDGHLETGERFGDLVKALKGIQVDAILPMCDHPAALSAGLAALNKVWDGITGAYANVGYQYARQPGAWTTAERDTKVTPTDYAAFVADWIELGALIIGGCCGTTPDHIATIRATVKNKKGTPEDGLAGS